jgi:pimeloyl-ACP methyl ester carboxylesterase
MPSDASTKPRFGSLEVNGADLAYVEAGRGELVLFVHGSLGSLSDFTDQLDPFSEQYRVVAYSRRFHPPNAVDGLDTIYAAERHARDLETVIRNLEERSAHIVGSSYGAYIGLILALRRPASVRSLVMAEPPILPLLQLSPLGVKLSQEFFDSAIVPSRAGFENGDAEEGVRSFVDGIIGHPGGFDAIPDEPRARLLEAAPELRLEFSTDSSRYMPDLDLEKLRTLPTPTLLLQGERSPRLFSLILNELERTIPNNERVIIPRAGHSLHLGNPAHFNRIVLRFLERACSSSPEE